MKYIEKPRHIVPTIHSIETGFFRHGLRALPTIANEEFPAFPLPKKSKGLKITRMQSWYIVAIHRPTSTTLIVLKLVGDFGCDAIVFLTSRSAQ